MRALNVAPNAYVSTENSRDTVAVDRVRAALTTLDDLAPRMLASLRARMEAKTSPEPNTGCHLWTGALNKHGYGSVGLGSRGHSTAMVRAAHRVAYLLDRGDLPSGVVLDHLCRNHACVNPLHLEPVSHLENVRRGCVARKAAQAIVKHERAAGCLE